MKLIKRIFVYLGNGLPPILNTFFYKLSGVKIGSGKNWIGNKCNFDTLFPDQIIIESNVCISFGVTLITHFDPTEGINNCKIKNYKSKILIKKGTFIGPNSTILPGVTIEENCFIRAGSVVTSSVQKNSIVEGNPGKTIGLMSSKIAGIINKKNYDKYF